MAGIQTPTIQLKACSVSLYMSKTYVDIFYFYVTFKGKAKFTINQTSVKTQTWPSRRTRSGTVPSVHQPSPGLADCHPSLLRLPLRLDAPVPGDVPRSPAAAAPAAALPGCAVDPERVPAHFRWTT